MRRNRSYIKPTAAAEAKAAHECLFILPLFFHPTSKLVEMPLVSGCDATIYDKSMRIISSAQQQHQLQRSSITRIKIAASAQNNETNSAPPARNLIATFRLVRRQCRSTAIPWIKETASVSPSLTLTVIYGVKSEATHWTVMQNDVKVKVRDGKSASRANLMINSCLRTIRNNQWRFLPQNSGIWPPRQYGECGVLAYNMRRVEVPVTEQSAQWGPWGRSPGVIRSAKPWWVMDTTNCRTQTYRSHTKSATRLRSV